MKKLLFVVAIIFVATVSSFSQVRLGVKGGVNFSSIKDIELSSLNATMQKRTGYQFGLALKAQIPLLGIGIQPELLYTSRSSQIEPNTYSSHSDPANLDQTVNVNLHYIEIPINFQLGLDLILLRPYLMVSPFFGYTINNSFKLDGTKYDMDWSNLNRWSSGIGVGAGLDIWKLQLSAKYSWNFGNMVKDSKSGESEIKKILSGKGNFKGLEVALAIFF